MVQEHMDNCITQRNGGKNVGSRKFKLNFKLMLGRKIGTIVEGQKNGIGMLKQVRHEQRDNVYRFVFENGFTLLIRQEVFFFHTRLRYEDENIFFEFSQEEVFSGMITYALYETVGLPLEFAIDEMKRIGALVDEEGFHVMENLQKDRNKNTFKNKDAFQQEKTL